MSKPNLFLAKRLDLLALEHLKRRAEEAAARGEGDAAKRIREAVALLAAEDGLGVALSARDRHVYGVEATLEEVVLAGLEQVGSDSKVARATEEPAGEAGLEGNPKWVKYLEVVKSKGVFASAGAEGSPEHEALMAKVKRAFFEKFGGGEGLSAEQREAREKRAEEHKVDGNNKIIAKDYAGAVAAYDAAIELSASGPQSHVFYANRAAAFSYLKQYDRAVTDCEAAVALNPSYAKAHSRLAQAHMYLGAKDAAKEAAERAVELEPQNQAALQVLEHVSDSRGGKGAESAAAAAGAPPGGLESLLGGGAGAGGMGDLAAMMGDPAMQAMMNDPAMAQMAQRMMQDPKAMENAMRMLGGMGGAPPGGRRR